jgi:hypothetical protein
VFLLRKNTLRLLPKAAKFPEEIPWWRPRPLATGGGRLPPSGGTAGSTARTISGAPKWQLRARRYAAARRATEICRRRALRTGAPPLSSRPLRTGAPPLASRLAERGRGRVARLPWLCDRCAAPIPQERRRRSAGREESDAMAPVARGVGHPFRIYRAGMRFVR